MKRLFLLVFTSLAVTFTFAQTCSPSGNVAVYTNYDGGIVTIYCDLNIPNLKVGICTYEAVEIHFTGPYVGNITQVIYAGFIGTNDNCGIGVTSTSISGVPAGITSILFAPAATQADPFGYPYIICGYSCGTGNQGGCNTSAQIAEYFTDTMGGSLCLYDTQYSCWQNETIYMSAGGSCCPSGSLIPQAGFTSSDVLLCAGQCISFDSQITGGTPTSYAWSFSGATPPSSSAADPTGICYLSTGVFPATLTVSNGTGSSSFTSNITVTTCGVPGCTYEDATNYNPAATVDDGSCAFAPCTSNCPADFDGNLVVNINDLLSFMAYFGSFCP